MSVILELEETVPVLLQQHTPDGVQVTAVDPSKWKTCTAGSIWIVASEVTTLGTRSIGPTAPISHQRRREEGTMQLDAVVYRESYAHVDAAAEASALMREIVASVEAMVEADASLSLGGVVSWAGVKAIKTRREAHQTGWASLASIDLEFHSRPS